MPVRVISIVAVLGVTACASSSPPAVAPASVDAATTTATIASNTTTLGTTAPSAPSSAIEETVSTTVAPPTVPVVVPEGFRSTTASITKPDGETCEVCLWVADDTDRRARGLMGVTDLGSAVGMAFVYPSPRTGTFWMKDTPLALSIVFYAPDGSHLGAFDMAPCSLGDQCPRYSTPADFSIAVEVPRGELDELGFVAGSRLELLPDAPCEIG